MSDKPTVCVIRCSHISWSTFYIIYTQLLKCRGPYITVHHRVLLWFYMGARLKGMWCSTYHILYVGICVYIYMIYPIPSDRTVSSRFVSLAVPIQHIYQYAYFAVARNGFTPVYQSIYGNSRQYTFCRYRTETGYCYRYIIIYIDLQKIIF